MFGIPDNSPQASCSSQKDENRPHKKKFSGIIKVTNADPKDSNSEISPISSSSPTLRKDKEPAMNFELNAPKPRDSRMQAIKKMPSMKYGKPSSTPSESFSNVSKSSSSSERKKESVEPPGVLISKEIELDPPPNEPVPVLVHVDLNDSPQTPKTPEKQPLRPEIPPLPLSKIEGIKISQNFPEVKDIIIDPADVISITSGSASVINGQYEKPASASKPEDEKVDLDRSLTHSSKISGSSDDDSIDLFKDKIELPEDHQKNQEKIPEKNPGFIEIPLPIGRPKNIYATSSVLSFDQILGEISRQSHIVGAFWENTSCLQRYCECFTKKDNIAPTQIQELLQFQNFCYRAFDENNKLHRDLFYSYYAKVTSRNELEMTNQNMVLLGLSSSNNKQNELSQHFGLAAVLHQIFLVYERPSLLRAFNTSRRPGECSYLKLAIIFMRESFTLLKRRKLNVLFNRSQNVIREFFYFHSGLIHIWVELIGRDDFTSSVREAVSRALNNPVLCREIFVSAA